MYDTSSSAEAATVSMTTLSVLAKKATQALRAVGQAHAVGRN